MPTFTHSLAVWLLLGGQEPQDPAPAPPVPSAATLLERYARLGKDQRTTVVRNMEKRLQREADDILQRIQSCQRGDAAYPLRTAPVWYEPRDYAPVATPRHVVAKGTDPHRAATHKIAGMPFLPDLHCAVVYDWSIGKAVRTGAVLGDDERFANYVHGYTPGADEAVAQALEVLDTDPLQRKLGAYFEHLYADREGRVFEGVTLFDAWHSGIVVEMPDTDAIAWARLILDTQSFVSPIPADRRRERLYARIKEGFADHREYRTLRLAAAAALVAAEPRIETTYEPLCRRSHWLWQKCEYQPKALAARFARTPDRTTLLREVDAAIEAEPDVIDSTRQALRATAEFLRALADYELGRANG